MANFRLPLSGDVTQAINPWQWALNATNGQFGLFNINLGQSADPQLEADILDEVGSYGRQLGRVGDVLEILLKKVDPATLDAQDRVKIEDFQYQLRRIQSMKDRRR